MSKKAATIFTFRCSCCQAFGRHVRTCGDGDEHPCIKVHYLPTVLKIANQLVEIGFVKRVNPITGRFGISRIYFVCQVLRLMRQDKRIEPFHILLVHDKQIITTDEDLTMLLAEQATHPLAPIHFTLEHPLAVTATWTPWDSFS